MRVHFINFLGQIVLVLIHPSSLDSLELFRFGDLIRKWAGNNTAIDIIIQVIMLLPAIGVLVFSVTH